MKQFTLTSNIHTNHTAPAIYMTETPFIPGSEAMLVADAASFAGTVKVQSMDSGAWVEITPTITFSAGRVFIRKIIVPEILRFIVTRTSGTLTELSLWS